MTDLGYRSALMDHPEARDYIIENGVRVPRPDSFVELASNIHRFEPSMRYEQRVGGAPVVPDDIK